MIKTAGAKFENSCYGELDDYVFDESEYSSQISVKTIRKYIASLAVPARILDLGCADGVLLADYSKFHQIFGLDISRKLVAKAIRGGVLAKVADIETGIPFGSSYFDIVVVHHVLEHLYDTDRILREINRVLKKSGKLLLTFPNCASPLSFLLMLLDLPSYQGARYRSAHIRDFTLRLMKKALSANGFAMERHYGGSFIFLKNNFLSQLTQYLPRLAADLTILAQKAKSLKGDREAGFDFGSVDSIFD